MSANRVVLAVDAASRGLTDDDLHVRDAFERRGIAVDVRLWGDRLDDASTVVIRSTWDYVDRAPQFRAWLDDLDTVRAVVHNSTPLLRWSMHKGYLVDLASGGVPVVPTVLVPRGDQRAIDAVIAELGSSDLVIKPAVGGTARLAVHTARVGLPVAATHLGALLGREDAIVQPYLPTIVTEGETSIVAIGGSVTHAVVKRPRVGDWRVQTDFGGTVELVEVDDEMAEIAGSALEVLEQTPSYARVDVVRHHARLVVLELELVEPELFFRLAPLAADALADHVIEGLADDV